MTPTGAGAALSGAGDGVKPQVLGRSAREYLLPHEAGVVVLIAVHQRGPRMQLGHFTSLFPPVPHSPRHSLR